MKTNLKNLIALAVVAVVLCMASIDVKAQQFGGFVQVFVPAGSVSTGFPIVSAEIADSARAVTAGSTVLVDSSGTYHRVAVVTFVAAYSATPLPTSTRYFIAGVCGTFDAPSGYRRIRVWRNIYLLDNPDTGTFDLVTEFCLMEIRPS